MKLPKLKQKKLKQKNNSYFLPLPNILN